MAATMFPKAQALVQEELDRVVGRTRGAFAPPHCQDVHLNGSDWQRPLSMTATICHTLRRLSKKFFAGGRSRLEVSNSGLLSKQIRFDLYWTGFAHEMIEDLAYVCFATIQFEPLI